MKEVQNLKDSIVLLEESCLTTIYNQIDGYHKEKDRIYKALSEDPHGVEKGHGPAMKKALDTKADKAEITKISE
jgi:hypothetical protein